MLSLTETGIAGVRANYVRNCGGSMITQDLPVYQEKSKRVKGFQIYQLYYNI